jgi:hypothetical protein
VAKNRQVVEVYLGTDADDVQAQTSQRAGEAAR